MRILMTHWVYTPEFSGAAMQGHRLAKYLSKLGVKTSVLTGTHKRQMVGDDVVDNIPVVRVLRERKSVYGQLHYWWSLDKYIRDNKQHFDLVHTHGFHPRINLAAKRAELPIVQKITQHSIDDPISVRNRPMGRNKMSIYNMSDAIIPTSHLLEETCRLQKVESHRVVRIPNGVDTELFHPVTLQKKLRLRWRLNAPEGKIILVAVGSVNEKKGLDRLIKALYKLDADLKKRICLWVIGPTTNQTAYKQVDNRYESFFAMIQSLITELDLDDVVQFKGHQDKPYEFLQAADIFVHPSRVEGQPNAILEAMSCGLPVVANLLPGITDEIVQVGKFGYLVDCDDLNLFAAALRVLIKNPTLGARLGMIARHEILSKYDLNQIAKRYMSLYSSLIHKAAFEKMKAAAL